MKASKRSRLRPIEQLVAVVQKSDEYTDWFMRDGLWNRPKPSELLWLSDDAWRTLWRAMVRCLIESARCGKSADFWKGLNAFTRSSRGRPQKLINFGPVLKTLAEREVGKSWLQIALNHCPKKDEKDHRCNRDCADRFRLETRRALTKVGIPLT
jgi:hypothetical protein